MTCGWQNVGWVLAEIITSYSLTYIIYHIKPRSQLCEDFVAILVKSTAIQIFFPVQKAYPLDFFTVMQYNYNIPAHNGVWSMLQTCVLWK